MSRRARALPAGVLSVALFVIAAPASVQAATCPALAYEATLVEARTALLASPPDLATARAAVGSLVAADPGGTTALRTIVADLATSTPATDDAVQRLTSITAVLTYPTGSTCNEDTAAARAALAGVYAAPDFRHLDDASQASLLTTVARFLASLVSRAGGALGPVGAVLAIAVVVLLVGIIGARRLRSASTSRARALDGPPIAGDDPDVEWSAAEAAAATGDFREAVRRAFRSALLDVAARGHVLVDPAWTTRELLAGCMAEGEVLATLAGAAALFDRAWYAGSTVTRADWDLAEQRCGLLRSLARRPHVRVPR